MLDRLVYVVLLLIAAAGLFAAWNVGLLDLAITIPALVIAVAALIGIVVFAKWRGVFANTSGSNAHPPGTKPPQP